MSVSKSFSDMKRVWKVTKKPTKKDYFPTLTIVVVGLVIIGIIALIMEFLNVLVIKNIFN